MWRKKTKPWDALSLRQLLLGSKPPTPAMAVRWYYWKFVLSTILFCPFMLYGSYVTSVISPGYQPPKKIGYWKYFARFLVINSRVNFFGLLLVLCGLYIIVFPATGRKVELWKIKQRQFQRKRWMPHRQALAVWPFFVIAFLCIAGFALQPLFPYCQLSWGGFFTHMLGGRIAVYLVFSSFLLEGARRWWQKNLADPYGTKRSFGQFAVIVLAWVAVLSVPVLFWFVGHSISAVAATHENPYVVQIRKYELSGRANYDPKIMCRIGEFYEKGEGVSRNYQKAMQWYKHADASGYYPAAMADIGLLYQHGLGVPRNYRMALNWYRLGVNARSARAMFYLGMLYDHGDGVARNRATAVKWWRKAARAGSPMAKTLLEKLRIDIY